VPGQHGLLCGTEMHRRRAVGAKPREVGGSVLLSLAPTLEEGVKGGGRGGVVSGRETFGRRTRRGRETRAERGVRRLRGRTGRGTA